MPFVFSSPWLAQKSIKELCRLDHILDFFGYTSRGLSVRDESDRCDNPNDEAISHATDLLSDCVGASPNEMTKVFRGRRPQNVDDALRLNPHYLSAPKAKAIITKSGERSVVSFIHHSQRDTFSDEYDRQSWSQREVESVVAAETAAIANAKQGLRPSSTGINVTRFNTIFLFHRPVQSQKSTHLARSMPIQIPVRYQKPELTPIFSLDCHERNVFAAAISNQGARYESPPSFEVDIKQHEPKDDLQPLYPWRTTPMQGPVQPKEQTRRIYESDSWFDLTRTQQLQYGDDLFNYYPEELTAADPRFMPRAKRAGQAAAKRSSDAEKIAAGIPLFQRRTKLPVVRLPILDFDAGTLIHSC